MTVLTEGTHAGEFIVSEANGKRSREAITVLSGETLEAGHIVGIETASGKYKEWNPGNTDGSETAAGVLFEAVDASAADADGVAVVRDAEINRGEVVYFTGATPAHHDIAATQLATMGIIAR